MLPFDAILPTQKESHDGGCSTYPVAMTMIITWTRSLGHVNCSSLGRGCKRRGRCFDHLNCIVLFGCEQIKQEYVLREKDGEKWKLRKRVRFLANTALGKTQESLEILYTLVLLCSILHCIVA